MRRLIFMMATAGIASVGLLAQNPNGSGNGNAYGYGNGNGANDGVVLVPSSSIEDPADHGRKAHTNHLIFLRAAARQSYLSGLTPAAIASAYNLSALGGGGIIAIVDAFHYPGAYSDLTTFSNGTGIAVLPLCSGGSNQACFAQVYIDSNGNQTTTPPPVNCGWNQEAALDIEWAHAMAPNASIVLVEAQSNSYSDLFAAVGAATTILGNAGGQVSMSWGGSEFAGETVYDSYFPDGSGIVFIAASGDTGGKTIYPSASPYVIAAGGTTLKLTGTLASPTFVSETGWSGSGGGASQYETRPPYQDAIYGIVGAKRGVPDFSFDADPTTGVRVYGPTCSGSNTGWMVFGGTSVSAPSLAGIINSAGSASSTAAELGMVYDPANSQYYRDIISGRAGKNNSVPGWDFVTGVGTPLTLNGK